MEQAVNPAMTRLVDHAGKWRFGNSRGGFSGTQLQVAR